MATIDYAYARTLPSSHRVVWSEGMLMSPQHLQQQDAYHESRLNERILLSSPYCWGLSQLIFDESALQQGTLSAIECDLILPDGLRVHHERCDIPARSFSELFPATQRHLPVHIGVPRTSSGLGNRYQRDTVDTEDEWRGGERVPVEIAKLNPKFLFDDNSIADYCAVRVADIVRDGDGRFRISKTYIPTVLHIQASKPLYARCTELLARMNAKLRSLQAQRKHKEAGSIEFSNSDVTRYLFANALAGLIPLLSAHLNTTTAPALLHRTLIQLRGQLSVFSSSSDIEGFPAYRHEDLNETFDPLFKDIAHLLGRVSASRCVSLPLRARKDGMWLGKIEQKNIENCRSIVMALEGDFDASVARERLPNVAKIASWGKISSIVRSATQGTTIRALDTAPDEIPTRPGQIYFELDLNSEFSRDFIKQSSVAIYLPPPYGPDQVTVSLMGIPRPSRSRGT